MTEKEDSSKSSLMDYRQARDYMSEYACLGSVPGLDSIRELLERLGRPQDSLAFIHVAGTNGKGSVCAFLRSALSACGYRAGAFTSPAVFSPLETIAVGGRQISRSDYARLLSQVAMCADEMKVHPTVFEMETALAFLYFKEKVCDIVVLECGLGGELDATNVIDRSVVSVITSVSMDHTGILGRSLRDIAGAKAGIMRRMTPVVTTAGDEEVTEVLREAAVAKGAAFYVCDPDTGAVCKKTAFGASIYDFMPEGERAFTEVKVGLDGAWQGENALLALKALCLLKKAGYDKITEGGLRRGFAGARHHGRFELISDRPMMVIDGAHNPDAALRLRESVQACFRGRRLIFIIGVFADKDVDGILKVTADLADQIITVRTPDNDRAMDAVELAGMVMKYNKNVTAASSVEEALEMAKLFAAGRDVIIAFGSLSYLGRLREAKCRACR